METLRAMRGGLAKILLVVVLCVFMAFAMMPMSAIQAFGAQTDPSVEEPNAPPESDESGLATLADTTLSSATGFGLTYVTNSTETTWDGKTIDISWYNTTDTVFHIKSAAQLIGLSAITSPVRGTLEESLRRTLTTITL